VWLAANSESYFNREAENLSKKRRQRPRYYDWLAATRALDGGRGRGAGFPMEIYLGTNVRFRPEFFEQQAQALQACPSAAPVRNVYGYLEKKPNQPLLPNVSEAAQFTFTVYEPAKDQDPIRGWQECSERINSRGLPALNGLIIPGMRNFAPTGGLNISDHRERLRQIAAAITGFLRSATARRWLEECATNPDPPKPEACKALAEAAPQFIGPEQEIAAEETEQQNQETAEYKLLQKFSRLVRDNLSPALNFEDLRRK